MADNLKRALLGSSSPQTSFWLALRSRRIEESEDRRAKILAGLPLPAAAATLAVAVSAAVAWIRWGARLRAWLTGTWTGLRLWQKLRKAGSALERA